MRLQIYKQMKNSLIPELVDLICLVLELGVVQVSQDALIETRIVKVSLGVVCFRAQGESSLRAKLMRASKVGANDSPIQPHMR
jgi:hypothetical protein